MMTPAGLAAALHDQLKPAAIENYRSYVLSRTPKDLQEFMIPMVDNDLAVAEDPTITAVANGQSVPVWASPSGWVLPGGPAKAVVVNNAFTRVDLPFATTSGIVNNDQNVAVQDSTGATVPGSPAKAVVAGHGFSRVTLPTTP